ncbi:MULTISPECIES: RHS repeat-associated core domain-containing protein [Pseudomonas]|uniref:RHS repeat-associated core domain-containing protein n=1 Tax=Pseudomonas vlassakiae TaxID=485888 RepID=A0A923GM87_9PSED|nr:MULTISPECIES: RHS repeat-associated core domain-containing protein [Pseudomonas]MBH3412671.1 RHS repeat-associated core domain-containing protein [Pseudomonas putida]MBV4543952.1 RHS repeat-associated core domain-containing protein [Pseudomonas vlassakiae]
MNIVASGVGWQAYGPYGYRNTRALPTESLGFNGEFFFISMGCYALGNSHRLYSPGLMRFISADTLSPFYRGGSNCYAYCLNDPINSRDPGGKSRLKTAAIKIQAVNRFKRPIRPRAEVASQWKTLPNLQPEELPLERWEAEQLIASGEAHMTLVKGPGSLERLPDTLTHKFVFTRDNNFLVGSFPATANISHAAIADLGQSVIGGRMEVVSAGYVTKGEGPTLTPISGHYRPSNEQLKPANDYLESLGANIRHG